MSEPEFRVGDRVQVLLDSKFWKSAGWFHGSIIRVDPYSAHRSFYWVELDVPVESAQGRSSSVISILNPKNIRMISGETK